MLGYFNTYIQKYWRSEKQKTYLEAGWTLLLITFFLFFSLRPTLLTALELRKKLEEAKAANYALDKKIQALNQARVNLEKVSADLPLLALALPDKPLVLDLLNYLKTGAGAANLTLSDLSYQDIESVVQKQSLGAVNEHTTPVTPFTIGGQGKYEDIKALMKKIESAPRLTQIVRFEIGRIKEEEGLQFTFSGFAFYSEEDQKIEK